MVSNRYRDRYARIIADKLRSTNGTYRCNCSIHRVWLYRVKYLRRKNSRDQLGDCTRVTILVSAIVSYFISTYVIDALAPSFGSEKNINKSAQLVAYASTAAWVAGIFHILPSLGILGILGLYSVYLFYVGLPIMKKTPEDKKIVYMIVSALVIIVVGFVIQMILMKIVYAILGNPYAGGLTIFITDRISCIKFLKASL
jgi:hypothetical protein